MWGFQGRKAGLTEEPAQVIDNEKGWLGCGGCPGTLEDRSYLEPGRGVCGRHLRSG